MLQGACGLSVHESASAYWARILAAEFRTPLDNPGYAPAMNFTDIDRFVKFRSLKI